MRPRATPLMPLSPLLRRIRPRLRVKVLAKTTPLLGPCSWALPPTLTSPLSSVHLGNQGSSKLSPHRLLSSNLPIPTRIKPCHFLLVDCVPGPLVCTGVSAILTIILGVDIHTGYPSLSAKETSSEAKGACLRSHN